MARPDASNVAASSTEHRQADMAAALHRSAELSSAQETDANETACWANEIDDKMSDAEKTQMQRNTYKPLALPTTFAAAPSSEHRQADVLAVHDSSRVVIARVRFYKAFSGEELFLPRQVCTKVRKESEAEWYFQWIAELVQRPQGFFRFVVTDVGGDSHVLEWKLRICERSHTPMTNLTKEDDGTVWIAVVEKDAPRDYADFKGLCVCDFGGCCKFCGDDVPSRCCGTNGCCRAGNCGHECCEKTRSADAAPSES